MKKGFVGQGLEAVWEIDGETVWVSAIKDLEGVIKINNTGVRCE